MLLSSACVALSIGIEKQDTRLFLGVITMIFIGALTLHMPYLLIAASGSPQRDVDAPSKIAERQSNAGRWREELAREGIDKIQEVVWMLNVETKELLYVSDAYESITGHSLREIRENPCSYKDLVHPKDRERFLAKLESAGTARRFDEEFRILRSDGMARWIWIKGTSTDDWGPLPRLVGIAQDITDRKLAELQIGKTRLDA